MTVEEMLDIWQRALHALDNGDYEAWLDFVDPRLEFETVPDWPDGGVYRGPQATWEFMMEFVSVFSAGRFEVVDPVALDEDRIILSVRRLTAGDHSGASVEFEYTTVAEFRNGRLLSTRFHRTREEALAAARDG